MKFAIYRAIGYDEFEDEESFGYVLDTKSCLCVLDRSILAQFQNIGLYVKPYCINGPEEKLPEDTDIVLKHMLGGKRTRCTGEYGYACKFGGGAICWLNKIYVDIDDGEELYFAVDYDYINKWFQLPLVLRHSSRVAMVTKRLEDKDVPRYRCFIDSYYRNYKEEGYDFDRAIINLMTREERKRLTIVEQKAA